MNKVILIGRLTKDIEIRNVGDDLKVAEFQLAVDNFSNGKKGVDFISCTVWNKQAEILAQYTSKGSLIAVEGSIANNSYKNKEGVNIHKTKINVSLFKFLDTKGNKQEETQEEDQEEDENIDEVLENKEEEVEINDDDLPF